METAVPTEPPAPTDESYPAVAPSPQAIEPYPDQGAETGTDITQDTAYPAEVNLSDITSEPNGYPPQEAPKPGVPDDTTAVSHQASQDLATRLGLDVSEITVASAETREWADSSFGCPAPGYAYAQVITSGYQITLEAGGEQYTYHTDLNGNFVLCGEDGQPVE
jgi:hypothetical protein